MNCVDVDSSYRANLSLPTDYYTLDTKPLITAEPARLNLQGPRATDFAIDHVDDDSSHGTELSLPTGPVSISR